MPSTPKRTLKPNIPAATKAKWMNKDNDNMKFYNSKAWRSLSRMQRERFPLCVHCKDEGKTVPMDHVDHIIPINQGGDPLDPRNLQSLCKRHHSIKTAKEKQFNHKNTEQ